MKCKRCSSDQAKERNLVCDIAVALCTECANAVFEVIADCDEYLDFLQRSRERETAYGRRAIKKTAIAFREARLRLRNYTWAWLAQSKALAAQTPQGDSNG